MRALCGAIISAGALIGLGLAAIGLGTRYNWYQGFTASGKVEPTWVHFWEMDTGLIIAMVLLIGALIVGLGIAILGLAYHHHRRHHEHLRAMAGYQPPSETRAPTT